MKIARFIPANACLPAVLAALAFPSIVAAAAHDLTELPLEDLLKVEVVSASKYPQSGTAAPSAVTVVSREDIRRFGWRTLSELLAAQRGFHAIYDRSYRYLGVRGFAPPGDYNNRILFLVDGMRVNDNIYDSVLAGEEFPLDLDLIERVEIVRGPGASIYGGNALFGVVNLVMRNGASFDGAELAADAGSRRTSRLRASAGKRSGDVEWMASASGFDSRGGQYEFPDVAPGVTSPDGADAERQQRFLGRLRLGEWQGTLMHSQRYKHVPSGSYGTIPGDDGHREDDGYTLGELAAKHRFGEHNELDFRLFGGQYRYDSTLPYDYSASGGPSRMINRDKQRGEWWGSEARLTSTAWAGQKWVVGLAYTGNTRQYQRNADDDGTVYLDTDATSHRTGIYAQDEITLGAATTLMLGLRHDVAEDSKRFTSPRLALVHQLDPANTVKLLYGTAYRNANAYERQYVPAGLYGNPDLGAERMQTLEAVWESRLGEGTRFAGSLYRYRVRDPISLDPVTQINVNAADVWGNGVELELERRWQGGAMLRGSYSGQFLREDGLRPDNAPAGLVQVNAGLPLGSDGWYAALELRGLAARKAASNTADIGGHGIANFTLSYRPRSSAWDLSASVYNLFDKRYDDPAPVDTALTAITGIVRERFAQDGRTFRLKAVARF
ncbi:TonB-dependent receptor plug domain-containing protein [Sulfurisoma sediminicola]|uniref:Iron complex outermembrane receptor protein n=1 Tax=Sulfurisoma sediminicola TaxID=1381557 RepID=A0A497XP35_9PROT|nr:TonB-dependent receptor [Sulfurisoma sediminicola]RLJ68138.1 iron complex outermembrane receptor protein [Sulfurisoma sediminicola]